MKFSERCGLDSSQRHAAIESALRVIEATGITQVRFAWCDLHGMLRGKSLMANAVRAALSNGVGMVSTLMLKDTSDRTAYKVFEAGGVADLPGFECASNLVLMADPSCYRQLPWAQSTGWLPCQPWFQNGTPVALDTRRILQKALNTLAAQGMGLQCGLEVEFHIYKIAEAHSEINLNHLDPALAAWPGLPPDVQLIHPGYNLLSEAWADRADAPLSIVRQTAQALGLPLISLEIELGPSQMEAVFDVTDALTAADNMVLFRSAVTQALRRAGYHATFMCRPPFANIMSSGWHLHQSLVQLDVSHQPLVQLDISHQSLVNMNSSQSSPRNLFVREAPAQGSTPQDAQFTLSELGEHYLAGLLAHAQAMSALATPTLNGFERFGPNAMAPQNVSWGLDNRGAMLRLVGQAGDAATRIENRIGEPAANPYLYMASQIYAGLDGIARQLPAPQASQTPYAQESQNKLPATQADALHALAQDAVLSQGLGADFVGYFCHIKQAELARYAAAEDKLDWQRREYFSRI